MDYDKITEHLGEFGKYHQCIYLLVCLPAVFVAMNMLSYVFNSATPLHRCFIQGCDNSSTSFISPWINETIPPEKNHDFKFKQCVQYQEFKNESQHCFPFVNFNSEVTCSDWKYDESVYGSTVVTTWDLVCSKSWMAPLSGSLWMFGVIVGAIVFGYLSDRYGRRSILLYSFLIFSITGFIIPFSVNYIMFLIIRIVQAAATTGIYQTAFVLGLEVVGQSKRVFCGIGISMAFALGEVLLGVLALYVRDWTKLQFYLAVPSVFFLGYYWILPESVRWLITRRRHNEAKAIIKKMAVFNKRCVPLELLDHDDDSSDIAQTSNSISMETINLSTSTTPSVFDLFRFRRLRWRTLNIFLNWFMNTIVYYGISMNATNLQGDVYVDFILISLVEIPAYIFCLLVLNRFGRKKPLVCCMTIGGLCCICTIFVPPTSAFKWVSIGLSLVGKFGCAAAFAIIYVFSIELFPTVLRNNGIGMSSFFAHIGGILAPYIANLSVYSSALPLLIFGSSSLIAGVAAIFLPETLNRKLPETVEDAENFTRNNKIIDKHSTEESEALIRE